MSLSLFLVVSKFKEAWAVERPAALSIAGTSSGLEFVGARRIIA
jgi:hypothetical protein